MIDKQIAGFVNAQQLWLKMRIDTGKQEDYVCDSVSFGFEIKVH